MDKIAAEDLAEGMEIVLMPSRRLHTVAAVAVDEETLTVEVLLSNGLVYRYMFETAVEYLA